MPNQPLYQAAETEMKRRIEKGEWPVGMRLGNEFVLAEEFGVSQGTMRRALGSLESAGLLDRKPGRGTLVAAKTVPPAPASKLVLCNPAGERITPTVHRALASTRGAQGDEAERFGTGRLSSLERVLRWNQDRIAIEEVIVPEARVLAFAEDGPLGFAELLSRHGCVFASVQQRVEAAITTLPESVTLACDRTTPLVVLIETAYAPNGAPLAERRVRINATKAGVRPA